MDVVDLTKEKYTVYLTGPPKPKPSPMFVRGKVVPPSKHAMSKFAKEFKRKVGTNVFPLFKSGKPVKLTIYFLMRRPDNDFVNRNRKRMVLKDTAAKQVVTAIKPDTDNLVKFVCDAIGGIAYHDDSQVVCLIAYKMKDSQGECDGGTILEIEEYNGEDIKLPVNYK